MTAIEDARRVLLDADAADDMSWPVTVTGMHTLMEALRALISDHEALRRMHDQLRTVANEHIAELEAEVERLTAPPTEAEREDMETPERLAADAVPDLSPGNIMHAGTVREIVADAITADRERMGPITDNERADLQAEIERLGGEVRLWKRRCGEETIAWVDATERADAAISSQRPPTDDEREALIALVNDARLRPGTGRTLPEVAADVILAAGFRRQGPITDAQEQAAFESWNGMHVGTVRDRLRAALEAAERAR